MFTINRTCKYSNKSPNSFLNYFINALVGRFWVSAICPELCCCLLLSCFLFTNCSDVHIQPYPKKLICLKYILIWKSKPKTAMWLSVGSGVLFIRISSTDCKHNEGSQSTSNVLAKAFLCNLLWSIPLYKHSRPVSCIWIWVSLPLIHISQKTWAHGISHDILLSSC